MTEVTDCTYTVVQKGDCAWKAAKKNLQASGKTVKNADIIKEMNRLAKLNGCESVDDFNNKFFSKIGLSFIIKENDTISGQSETNQNLSVSSDSVITRPVSLPGDSTRIKKTALPAAENDSTEQKNSVVNNKDDFQTEERYVQSINYMTNDQDRIIEYNKKNYEGKYYGIVDKKTCQLKIYDKKGNVVKSFTVGVGKTKGDNLQAYYMEHYNNTKDAYKAESNRYTTAGEFTLDEYETTSDAYIGKDGKTKVMSLKGDNRGINSGQMSIHMLYKPQYEQRKAAIDSAGLEDNRMSYGCVNLTEEDYDLMHKYLGEGDKIYVLPEEKGNKLQLEKQSDGTYKFEQTYHKEETRGVSKETASRVNYDVRPERDPEYIAQQKKKKDEEEKLLALQKAKQETESRFCWYKPNTWFS